MVPSEVVKVSVARGKVDVLEHRTGALAKQLGAGMSWTMGQRELPKAAQQASRVLSEVYTLVSLGEGLIVIDERGIISRVNSYAQNALGYQESSE